MVGYLGNTETRQKGEGSLLHIKMLFRVPSQAQFLQVTICIFRSSLCVSKVFPF